MRKSIGEKWRGNLSVRQGKKGKRREGKGRKERTEGENGQEGGAGGGKIRDPVKKCRVLEIGIKKFSLFGGLGSCQQSKKGGGCREGNMVSRGKRENKRTSYSSVEKKQQKKKGSRSGLFAR